MSRGIIFLIVLSIIALVGGALLLIGVLEGDDTDVDKNGVNSAPVVAFDTAPAWARGLVPR